MKIKPDPPRYDEFDAASEQAGDKDLAVRLTRLFTSLEHGTVAIFDGRWGIGKTTFVRRWISHLQSEGIPTIYLDAFSVDYIESPFVAIAAAFAKAGEDANKRKHPTYKAFVDNAAKVGRSLRGAAAKIGVKAVTLGLIGASEIEDLNKVREAVTDALGDTAQDAVKSAIEEHSRKEKELNALRGKLAEFPALLSGSPPDELPPPLVFVIDELDRCRPDFALGLLESIKHFFGVDRVHFVLVTNRDHLVLSVAHKYGAFPTADEYLRKFYDFQINYDHDYSSHHGTRIGQRVEELSLTLLKGVQDRGSINDYMRAAAVTYRLTMRDIENVYLNLTLAYASLRPRRFRPALVITVLCLLKTLHPKLFAEAKAGTLNYEVLNKHMFSADDWGGLDIERIRKLFRYYLDPKIDVESEEWKMYGRDLWEFSLDRLRVVPWVCQSVIDLFEPATQTEEA